MQAKRFLAVNLNLFEGLIHAKSKVKTNSIFFSTEFLKAKLCNGGNKVKSTF